MSHASILPSSFVAEWVPRLAASVPPPGRALDVAMGRGRHAVLLASAGFRTFGVDNRLEAVRDARARVAAAGSVLRAWCADLTQRNLPAGRFELILVTRYLQRDLFPILKAALTPGGVIVYETFIGNSELRAENLAGPTSPDHLLRPGELRGYFEDFELVFDEEVSEPETVARLVARRHA